MEVIARSANDEAISLVSPDLGLPLGRERGAERLHSFQSLAMTKPPFRDFLP